MGATCSTGSVLTAAEEDEVDERKKSEMSASSCDRLSSSLANDASPHTDADADAFMLHSHEAHHTTPLHQLSGNSLPQTVLGSDSVAVLSLG